MDENTPRNSETIYRALKHDILDLSLKPGQTVSESELCHRFGVSRTPVRTALQRLQSENLVDVVPYKGSTVTLLDFNEIRQTIYMRAAVESAVLRDFIPLCTPLLEEKIRYLIRKQTVLISGDFETERFYQMDSQLHAVWFSVTNKERLWRMIQRAQIHYTRFRMLDIVAAQNFREIIGEHEQLFRLICARDAQGVEPLVRKHLNGGIERLGDRIYTDFRDYFLPEEKDPTEF